MLARRLAKSVARIAAIPVIIYAGLCAFVYTKQDELLFLPEQAFIGTPEKVGLRFDDVSFESGGHELHGWFVPAKGTPRATVLHCHGNGGNVSYLGSTLSQLHDHELTSLVFDYRGYGKSEGATSELSEADLYADADAAWRFLTKERGVDPASIVFWGQSMGGGVCSWLAKEKGGKALVLEGTFTRLSDVAADIYWFLPVRLLASYRLPTVERLPTLTMPVVVAHSADDDVIPFSHAKTNFAALRSRKLFLELRHGHVGGFDVTPNAMTEAIDFLTEPAR